MQAPSLPAVLYSQSINVTDQVCFQLLSLLCLSVSSVSLHVLFIIFHFLSYHFNNVLDHIISQKINFPHSTYFHQSATDYFLFSLFPPLSFVGYTCVSVCLFMASLFSYYTLCIKDVLDQIQEGKREQTLSSSAYSYT